MTPAHKLTQLATKHSADLRRVAAEMPPRADDALPACVRFDAASGWEPANTAVVCLRAARALYRLGLVEEFIGSANMGEGGARSAAH